MTDEWQTVIDAKTYQVQAWKGDLSNMRLVHHSIIESRVIPLKGEIHGLVTALASEIHERDEQITRIREWLEELVGEDYLPAEDILSQLEEEGLL